MLGKYFVEKSSMPAADNAIKNKDILRYIMAGFVICFLFFRPFLRQHFSIDAYVTMERQRFHWSVSAIYIRDGRYIGAVIVKILDALGINLVLNTALGVFVFMFCCACCIAGITYACFEDKPEDKNYLDIAVVQLGAVIGFCNVFISEWYCFTECLFVYSAAVLGSVFAALAFRKNRKILSFVLLSVGYNCYQPVISIFVFLILFFILKKYSFRFDMQAVKETLSGAFECAGVFLINYLITRMLLSQGIVGGDSRYNAMGFSHIIKNIYWLFWHQRLVWMQADGMMDLPIMAAMIVLMLCLFVIVCLQKKHHIKDFCYTIIMLAGGVFVVFLPIVVQEVFWIAPRTVVPLFFIYTVLAFYIAFQGKKWVKVITAFSLCIFLAVMMRFVHIYAEDLLYSDSMDQQYINIVEQKIEDYERENNIKVEYLGFASDANTQLRWDLQGQYAWDVAPKGILVAWSQVQIFNYHTGRSYEKTEVPEEYTQYFLQNDWNSLEAETQVRFEGNKCYIAIF